MLGVLDVELFYHHIGKVWQARWFWGSTIKRVFGSAVDKIDSFRIDFNRINVG